MKRALIAIASVGGLVPAAWLLEANAQQMSLASPPSQAYAPSQMAPTQAYVQQRRARRYARRAPAVAAVTCAFWRLNIDPTMSKK